MINIKELRKEHGWTGVETAERSKISYQHYNFIENGKRRPSVPVAKRIAAVLGFDWTRFYEDGQGKRGA